METATETAAAHPPRRVPTQQRSRERVERILAVAKELIAERGSDAVRMSEMAERAGVSIGSLYQYFPDKAAVVRTLAERFNAEGLACVKAELEAVMRSDDLHTALCRVTDGFYGMYLAEPALRDIWSATQSDKSLQELDAADIAAHAALLGDVLARLRPGHDPAEVSAVSLLTVQMIAAAVRLAISRKRGEGDAVLALFKERMLPRELP
jgi:AcrR family transcriptional regulator